jgi:rod shape-determining protein MreD
MHACFLGLIVDILLGSTLGVNALLLSLVSYFVTSNYQKICNFNMAKTTITIGILVFVDYLFLYWIASSERNIVLHDYYFIPVLTSMLIWPWFFLLMRFARTKFKV